MPLWIIGGLFNGACNVLTVVLIGRRVAAPVRGQGFARFSAAANTAGVVGFTAGGLLLAVLRAVRRPVVGSAGSVTAPAAG